MTEESPSVPAGPGADTLQFDYIKANGFRVIHVDGAIGNVTASGMIHMALYSERPAIPQTITFEVGADGKLGAPVEWDGRRGFVREVDVDAIMSAEVAQSLVDWLQSRLADLKTVSNVESQK